MAVAATEHRDDDTVVVKKYANRRLYNTQSSSYITLEDLARMTRNGVDFVVLDAKTGADITHSILTQIIMEEEASGGEQMLPVGFLRQLIAMYGNSMQSMMPQYLEASMANFQANQGKLQEAWKSSVGPEAFAKLAETNMAMFNAAASAFIPKHSDGQGEAKPATELDELKAQMAAMQKKLDELGK
jgi:polyhydroxyalkanoate synthesis repressor PhaR